MSDKEEILYQQDGKIREELIQKMLLVPFKSGHSERTFKDKNEIRNRGYRNGKHTVEQRHNCSYRLK